MISPFKVALLVFTGLASLLSVRLRASGESYRAHRCMPAVYCKDPSASRAPDAARPAARPAPAHRE